jgi:hypothetical protein
MSDLQPLVVLVRLFVVQPFDQSYWIGAGPLGRHSANGVTVARLRAINAARIQVSPEFFISLVGRDVRLMDALTP